MQHITLTQAFLVCENEDEVNEFLFDLLTVWEREEFSQRLDIARRLSQGQSYKTIETETGVSSTTIARVAKFLYRQKSWYKNIFDQQKYMEQAI